VFGANIKTMPLSPNEIRARAASFAREWAQGRDERAQAQAFWIEFFDIFGLRRPRVASFEHAVKKHGGGQGFIDLFWPGMLLIEHKSRGASLQRAHAQAMDYFPGLKERELPRYVLVSDFARLRLYDLEQGSDIEFPLADLPKHIRRFNFIAGYQTQDIRPQDPVNERAAWRMAKLHDALKASGYAGKPLEVLLVRLLFCLFADDTGIFQPAQAFRGFVEERTADDGSDLGAKLAELFQVLNTPEAQRSSKLDEQLAAFPYVNGALFATAQPIASFDASLRDSLLEACALDWSLISPAIFGAMFQGVMDDQARRSLGAHYTSEENILKLIGPLFLDELRAEFERVKRQRNRLFEFHKKLRSLNFFDPACGCGNFLVITYRELRSLELDVLRAAYGSGQQALDVHQLIAVNVDQFHGIEIEEFPAQIAQVAMWLIDHQMNLRVSDEFGAYYARIPLKTTPHILQGNALRLDWAQVLPPELCSYVLGNPPFVGAKYMSDGQRADAQAVFAGLANGGLLDFVAAWYVLAARYIKASSGPVPRVAFVSTNSITQGEQVGVLWGWMLAQQMQIHFAHRTFQWSNEGRGVAAVHCVIIGFGPQTVAQKWLFDYDSPRGKPHALAVANINPYLVDAPDVVLPRRSRPICDVPEIGIGNKPIDDGNYLFTTAQRDEFLRQEPGAAKFFRRWLGADEFINGYERWCLWLGQATPAELRALPHVMNRVQAVKAFRLASKSAPTRKLADTPTRFHVENMPNEPWLLVPEVSSERRDFIPIGYETPSTLGSNLVKIVPSATLVEFAILTSTLHNAWIRYTCGRLESRYRYSAAIVYNNFPWPSPNEAQKSIIEAAAQTVLDTRAQFPGSTLADLYDPLSMPPALLKAHRQLDAAVDAAYGPEAKACKTDAERVAFLFRRYQQLTTLLPEAAAPKKRAPRRRTSVAPPAT
jgi:hypothetical protein